jgi:hypothetical protein
MEADAFSYGGQLGFDQAGLRVEEADGAVLAAGRAAIGWIWPSLSWRRLRRGRRWWAGWAACAVGS